MRRFACLAFLLAPLCFSASPAQQLEQTASALCREDDEACAAHIGLLQIRQAPLGGKGDVKPREAELKAAGLVSNMTRKEKYGIVRGRGYLPNTYEAQHGWFVGNTAPVPRLGIPSLNLMDSGNGFRTLVRSEIGEVTSWPSALAAASTWDEELIETWARALGGEFRMKGANVLLGPALNVHRVARGGRNVEYTSGESPYLGARLAPPFVRGVHSQHVLTVMKHFVTNNQETRRNYENNIVDNRTLWEVHYPPFVAAIEAGCLSAMCSYNLINGVHECASVGTLLTDLKGAMGFQGWVMSDWWAAHNFSAAEGMDQEMPGEGIKGTELFNVTFTEENLDTLSDAKLDDMTRRIVTPMVRHGLLEHPVCHPPKGCDDYLFKEIATGEENRELARRLAAAAVVLLKNEGGVLPLRKHFKLIAVLGSACNASNDIDSMLSRWDLGNYYTVGGSGRVIPKDPVSVLQGLQARCEQNGECRIFHELRDDAEAAAKVAVGADVAVICAATTSKEGDDRTSLSVDQEAFVVEVVATLKGVPKVVLTVTPGPVVMPWIQDADAALNLFLAGEATGEAFAAALFGDVNPSGKLPVTFPLREADAIAPCPSSEPDCYYSEGVFAGFPHYEDKEVFYPFGHGLSYTSSTSMTDCKGALECFVVRIRNIGMRPGVEVVQLYLGFPAGSGEPEKVLRGFRRADLMPSESVDIVLPLLARDMQVFSMSANAWRIPDGSFRVFIGSSSRDIRLTVHQRNQGGAWGAE